MGGVFRAHWLRRSALVPAAALLTAAGMTGPAAAVTGKPGAPTGVTAAVTGKPGAPTGATAAARDRGAVVSWTPPVSDGGSPVTGYVITASPGGASVRTAAVTSFLAGGLTDGTAYTFTVAAVNASGTGPASRPSAAVTPRAATVPGPPRTVTAAAGFGQASVSWAAPKSDGGAPVTGYRLTTSPATSAVTVGGDARSATVTGLSDGTAYRILVAAANSAGRGSAARSAPVTPRVTVPGPPLGVTAAPVASGVTVTWQPPASDGGSALSGYVVTVAGTGQTVTAGPGARSATVTGLASGTPHTFGVAASNAQGTGPAQASPPAAAGGSTGGKTVVLSAPSLAALTQVQTNGSLVFTSPPKQVRDLAAGDIVVAGVSTAAPGGLLAKVTSVSTAGSTVTVATVRASLDQALSAAGFGATAALTRGQVARFVPARPGVRLLAPGRATGSAAPGSIGLSLDTDLYKSADGRTVTVKGDVSLSPSVTFAAQISCCVHTASQFTGSVTASASLSVTAETSHDISGGYTLGTFDFTPVAIDVLGVPVVIVPSLTVKLIAKGSVTAGVTAGAGASVTVGAQVTTADSKVSAHPFTSHSTSFTPPTIYGSMSAAGGVEADLSATVDGIAGATLTDQLWLAELSVDPSQSPWWTLSAENVVGVDFHLSLLDHDFGSYTKTLSDVTIPLAQATDPYQGITITPDPAVVAPGGTLQLAAQVGRVAAQQVTWSAPAGNGTITAAGRYTAPATPGTYQVTATQPASGLSPGAVGLLSIQAGDQPPGPPTGPAASSTSPGAATVTWTPPADTGGGAITGYTITASPGGRAQRAPGAATSGTMTGLTPGATYTFTVTATGDGGTGLPSAATGPVVIDDPAAGPLTWTVAETPRPPGGTISVLDAIACGSATACAAAGYYVDAAGNERGLLVTGSGTSWTATRAPLPPGAAANPSVSIYSVACPGAASCVALGQYNNSAGTQQGLLLDWNGTAWTAVHVPLPTDGVASFGFGLATMSCAAGGPCAAAGLYTQSTGRVQGFLLTGSGTSWRAVRAPVPRGAVAHTVMAINAVSCASASLCVAAGSYGDPKGVQGGLDTWNGTSWTATKAPVPVSASSNPGVTLDAVSCAAGACAVTGGYDASTGAQQGLLLTWNGGAWTAAKAPLPAGTPAGAEINVVSAACTSATDCVAGGSYTDITNGNGLGLLFAWNGSSWAVNRAPTPIGTQPSSQDAVYSVSCGPGATCTAGGQYANSGSTGEGLLLTGSGTSWAATEAPLPAGADPFPATQILAVACPSATACGATGTYYDGAGNTQGLLLTGSG